MQKVLMILTSHRLDCFSLAIDFLDHGGSLYRFDVVTMLCSGVRGRHLRYVESLPRRFPTVHWDIIHGPRGRGKPISDLQNECVRRHPDSLYFKLDEDTLVSRDWDLKLTEAYEAFKNNHCLSLISAVVTNNQRGAFFLMNLFPELGVEFTRTFNQPIINERMGPVWLYPQCAEFMIRRFLSLDRANEELRQRLQTTDYRPQTSETKNEYPSSFSTQAPSFAERLRRGKPSTKNQKPSFPCLPGEAQRAKTGHPATLSPCYPTFSYPFSINCIAYDYRHWKEIGGVPEEDENGWGKWIPENGKFIILVQDALVHHYSFFVQQDWLDRTNLLEDLATANLPNRTGFFARCIGRFTRIVRQMPRVIRRRLIGKQ